MVYVRPAEKEHGAKKRVEGGLADGKRVVPVEDLVTTGGSALSATSALRAENLICSFCVSIVDYGFHIAAERFAADGVVHRTPVDAGAIFTALEASGVSEGDVNRARAWYSRVNQTGARSA